MLSCYAHSQDWLAERLPRIGPHPEVLAERQVQIDIPADKLYEAALKIVRGCELWWFSNGRIVESPCQAVQLRVRKGFCARSRNARRHYLSFCWQKR